MSYFELLRYVNSCYSNCTVNCRIFSIVPALEGDYIHTVYKNAEGVCCYIVVDFGPAVFAAGFSTLLEEIKAQGDRSICSVFHAFHEKLELLHLKDINDGVFTLYEWIQQNRKMEVLENGSQIY